MKYVIALDTSPLQKIYDCFQNTIYPEVRTRAPSKQAGIELPGWVAEGASKPRKNYKLGASY